MTLGDICTRFYIGKTQLCKLFEEHVGKSPIEYFSSLKLAEAKRLLRQSDLSVSRISDMLCYSSIHNFSRAFKKSVGISPIEYRNKLNQTI
jgi:AraC-like DNA-binding protein